MLERLLEDLAIKEINPDYRLWLSAEPCPQLPAFLLQTGAVVTLEPPRGVRATLIAALDSLVTEPLWERQDMRVTTWKKLLFGLVCPALGPLLSKTGPINKSFGVQM